MKHLCILAALPWLAACGDNSLEDIAQEAKETAEEVGDAIGQAVDEAKKWTIHGEHMEQRRRHCDREGGVWMELVEVSPCKDGSASIKLSAWDEPQEQTCDSGTGGTYDHQCVYYTTQGRIYFNDGPSQPSWIQGLTKPIDVDWDVGRWASLFWASAVNHDYCYHHNGITRGYDHQACDEQMLSDLSAICAQERFAELDWFEKDLCKTQAAITFATVRTLGDESWEMMSTQVDYPTWVPLWQKYDMAEDVKDEELAHRVQDWRTRINDFKATLSASLVP